MAVTALLTSRLVVGGFDFTCKTNEWKLDLTVADLPATTYCSGGWAEVVPGLRTHTLKLAGYNDYAVGDVDQSAFSQLSGAQPFILAPDTAGADGALAYLGQSMVTNYKSFGKVGELAPFEVSGKGSGWVARGTVLHPAVTARTVSGVGASRQLGALTAGQAMACAAQFTAFAGTSPVIALKLQSASDAVFTTPVDRVTFGVAGTVGAQRAQVSGPITDTWWRLVWTITGTTPSVSFAAAAGIISL